MGNALVQGELWGAKARDWAEAQEPCWTTVYKGAFSHLGLGPGIRLLDIGCGAGGALLLARSLGAEVTGLDAAAALIDIARQRLPSTRLEVGEIEALPFPDGSFDVVTSFNAIQFTANPIAALSEAGRVCRRGGTVGMLVWGLREHSDLSRTVLPAIFALTPPPPPPPDAPPPPPPLATPGRIEGMMESAGLDPVSAHDIDCTFDYPDMATAIRALTSPGPIFKVAQTVGAAAVEAVITEKLGEFAAPDGTISVRNRFRLVTGRRPN